MRKIPVIAIFDVGKTNKKLLLFDEQYKIVFEKTARFRETVDEDHDPCENLDSLRFSVYNSLQQVLAMEKYEIKAINFSTYGASMVYLNEQGKPLAPLYNYLKEYPEGLRSRFYEAYGPEEQFALETASPAMGSLNSGLQLYRIKHEKPQLFAKIKYVMHLPQYLSSLITGQFYSDVTSIGCHTGLWDFNNNDYHHWLTKESVIDRLPPLATADTVIPCASPEGDYVVGIGLHDSSAALIPYQANFADPFVLLSTGTWCISMNPFNHTPLTTEELLNDCLCYLQYRGEPVKSSRLFAGWEYEQQVKRIAQHFGQDVPKYRNIAFDLEHFHQYYQPERFQSLGKASGFESVDLGQFKDDIEAYYELMVRLIHQQYLATSIVLKDAMVKRIFVTGGFGKNAVFMSMLAQVFPDIEVFAASMPQASAIGAAMAIHKSWNMHPMANDAIELKYYSK
ncbi:carbohydrate kinase, FGGY [Pedobacter sp. BAL39]|uniref:FGGY-family carbohydrate kinase n=1 Tax=Pedobacter sp. BAL39 TaxID=391596 RepID=UPI0001559A41|nr:FGGY family carbohydrate kinase [Pedobacter sp. BAL39]EDM35464.1 carbohydrate kinase, FGGY [Pedobacter sp. BAL39]